MTLAESIDQFLAEIAVELKPATVRSYQCRLASLRTIRFQQKNEWRFAVVVQNRPLAIDERALLTSISRVRLETRAAIRPSEDQAQPLLGHWVQK